MDNLEFSNAMRGLNTPGEFAHHKFKEAKPTRGRRTKMNEELMMRTRPSLKWQLEEQKRKLEMGRT